MCLYTKQRKPKIAEQDIVCYKRVLRTEDPDIFMSEHVGFKYKIGKTYKKYFWNHIDIRLIPNALDPIYSIYGGVFHSFAGKIAFPFKKYAILECVIPRGTRYYEGIFSDYCSRTIKIVREI